MKIAIVCTYPFPYGMAATNRIIAYSKGMIADGADVEVILLNPLGGEKNGIFEGINYINLYKTYKSKYKIIHFIDVAITILLSLFYIRNQNRKSKYSALIISSDTPFLLYIFSRFCRFIKVKSIFIADEYPIPIRSFLKERIPAWKQIAYQMILRKIDAYVMINQKLIDYYCSIVPKPAYELSAIVDTDRFNRTENFSCGCAMADVPKIVYMGNMELTKDNMDIIIKAFAKLLNKYPNFALNLYGNASPKDKKHLENVIREWKIEKKVSFGYVQYDDVPKILSQAAILVSSQPNTVRVSGGFSTKLGEYLASNKPTLMTDVGENAKYFTDSVHCYFANPNDVGNYAEKLIYIAEHPEEARRVAETGRKMIVEHFSHLAVGRKLIGFIAEIADYSRNDADYLRNDADYSRNDADYSRNDADYSRNDADYLRNDAGGEFPTTVKK
jgi:glycosyltransferase involved in cell wall biosynthesis